MPSFSFSLTSVLPVVNWIRPHIRSKKVLPSFGFTAGVSKLGSSLANSWEISVKGALKTAQTFTDYLGRVRFEKAKNLLLNPHLRVSEIAYDVGFQSHFSQSGWSISH
jgi:hypothetical protein